LPPAGENGDKPSSQACIINTEGTAFDVDKPARLSDTSSVGGPSTGLDVPSDRRRNRKPSIAAVAPDCSVIMCSLDSDAGVLVGSITSPGRETGPAMASEEDSISDYDTSPTAVADKEHDNDLG